MKITKDLYDNYQHFIKFLCQNRAGYLWEDASSEVWLQIHRAKEWVEGNGSLPNYIKKIAKNTIYAFIRDQKSQRLKWVPKTAVITFNDIDKVLPVGRSEDDMTLQDIIPDVDRFPDLELSIDYFRMRKIGRDVLKPVVFNACFQPESVEHLPKSTNRLYRNQGVAILKEYAYD